MLLCVVLYETGHAFYFYIFFNEIGHIQLDEKWYELKFYRLNKNFAYINPHLNLVRGFRKIIGKTNIKNWKYELLYI